MEIKVTQDGIACVLELIGRLDSIASKPLESKITDLVEEKKTHFLLDLEQLSYISSAGLRTILTGAKAIERNDGKIVLCSLTGDVKNVFNVSGFIDIFSVEEDRIAALAQLDPK